MIILPIAYLFLGFFFGRIGVSFKKNLSFLLTKIIIPIIIVYNISINFSSMSKIIIATIILMLIAMAVLMSIFKDPVKTLCISYLNIGWLGLPIATSLFGEGAQLFVIAAYVGSSIIGNSLGANLLSSEGVKLIKIFKTPPMLAVLLGVILIPLHDFISKYFEAIYVFSKFLMSFLGMAILGMWLSETQLSVRGLGSECKPYFMKALLMSLCVFIVYLIAKEFDVAIITQNVMTLLLFCFLPPAANIIVLETHYMGTGTSVPKITYGTILSIISITIYAGIIVSSRLLGLIH